MRNESRAFFDQLLAHPSVSGYEQCAQTVVRNYTASFADSVNTDVHGNVTAVLNGEGRPRVQFAGHIDQIGFQVLGIEETGFLRIAPIGGHDPMIVLGQAVVVWTKSGPLNGVLARKPIHVLTAEERRQAPQFSQLHVDCGLTGDQAKDKVAIGDPITYELNAVDLAHNIISSPGTDDKTGVYVVMEALRLLAEDRKSLVAGVYAVATVQEELHSRGAITSAYRVDPDVAIASDVTFATDLPGDNGRVKIGGGPVITRGPNINPKVFELLVEAAEENDIPHQIKAVGGNTGTDAREMQLNRGGVATGLVSTPNRYMHTPVEVISADDLDNCAALLAAFVRKLTPDTNFIPD